MNTPPASHPVDDALLPPAAVLGLGAITPLGRGPGAITQAMHARASAGSQPSPGVTAMQVDPALLQDKATARHLRRADPFIRMATLAAMDAWQDAGDPAAHGPMERVGMIVASALGSHQRGFRFLDGILDHGDSAALPTDFSHSVHGASCATIAGILDLRGPTFSLTDFRAAFAQAVLLAQCWLHEGLCDRVLVGNVEELGPVLLRTAQRVLPDGESYLAGEGATFLLLGPGSGQPSIDAGHVTISACHRPAEVDLLIADHGVFPPRADHPSPSRHARAANFTPMLGHNAGVLATQTLGGLLAMRDPTLPLPCDRPHPHPTTPATPAGIIRSALTYVSDAPDTLATLCLAAPHAGA